MAANNAPSSLKKKNAKSEKTQAAISDATTAQSKVLKSVKRAKPDNPFDQLEAAVDEDHDLSNYSQFMH